MSKKNPSDKEPVSEPVKKRIRAKKQKPTKEEKLKSLTESSNELKQIIQELKEDEMRLSSMPLKKVPELLKETLNNLDEDLKEIEEIYQELLAMNEDDKII